MRIMRIKKITALLISFMLTVSVCLLTACNKDGGDGETLSTEYTGILTKIRLGMPLTKIVGLQRDGVKLYYETDTVIWAIDTDTDLMDIKNLIPEDNMYYYTEDSLITYNFKTKKGDTEIYLNGFSEELYCLMDRVIGNDYFKNKTIELSKQHSAEAIGSMTGTEGVDMELTSVMQFSCTSYDVYFTMVETYDTVDSVDDYYVTYYKIEVKEKDVKETTDLTVTT